MTTLALEHKASDIHLRADAPPYLRIQGDVVPVQVKALSAQDLLDIAGIVTGKKDFPSEYDGSLMFPGLCRMRYNFFRYEGGLGASLRIVTLKVPSLDSLKLPPILKNLALKKQGLILVTGPTGSGKSTTLAAMIDFINTKKKAHIVTLEDPIEFLHTPKKSCLSQREIGRDTPGFSSALRASLRQDPDVILFGEIRDEESLEMALKAAETGHVVFSTLHTSHALATIGRMVSLLPSEAQGEGRRRLAVALEAAIGQKILKGLKKKAVLALEIMVSSPGIREAIEGTAPLEQIDKVLRENYGPGGNGSQSFDQDLMDLYKRREISKQVALEAVSSQSDFIQSLNFRDSGPQK